jgi:hypothetical protein
MYFNISSNDILKKVGRIIYIAIYKVSNKIVSNPDAIVTKKIINQINKMENFRMPDIFHLFRHSLILKKHYFFLFYFLNLLKLKFNLFQNEKLRFKRC